MARQRKNLTVKKDKFKKTSVVEPTIDATQSQEIIRPINPVVNYQSLGTSGNGYNFDFSPYYGKGYDDITNRAFYTAIALLNTDTFAEETQRSFFRKGFAYFAKFLELFRCTNGEDLTQADITPELIEQYILYIKGSELTYVAQRNYYSFTKSLLTRMKENGYWSAVGDINLNNDFFPKYAFSKSKKRNGGGQKQAIHPPQPSNISLEEAINGSVSSIVTYIKLANDEYQTLSRYEDDIWMFPASKGTKATPTCKLKLNFAVIADTQMKRMAKWVVWNKMKEDLAVASLLGILSNLKAYFQWVLSSDSTATQGLTAFTSNAYVKYVNTLTSTRKGEVKPLAGQTKASKFFVLEYLYHYCKAFDFVKEHPWSESSAHDQAGHVGEAYQEARKQGKTLIIPDDVLIPLCQFTKSYLDRADEILASAKNNESLLLRDSCIFWLLLTTGMPIHEILGIKRGAYRSETRDETTYYYIKTVSEKTHTGVTEWIAPKIATEAIDILSQLSAPLQAQLEHDVLNAKKANNHAEIHRLEQISNHICLAKNMRKNNTLTIISGDAVTNLRLPNLCKQIGSDWHLAAHQFRRTFAYYVVCSELGVLSALKDHFKHWSITISTLHTFSDNLDAELFEELLREKFLVEQKINKIGLS